MKPFTPVPKLSFILFYLIIECVSFTLCLNMWTSLEQKQAANKPLVKTCVSPCKIFHSWCKNDGKCREKGRDCTWYCECPSNCEGFFCEKKVEKDTAKEGGQNVEVKVAYEREKKKPVSAFDKSKLAQALAGIFLKEKQTDEEKKTVLPETIERVGNTINTKENVTAKVIINCPPGELNSKAPVGNQNTESTTKTTTSNTPNTSNKDSETILQSPLLKNATSDETNNMTTNPTQQTSVTSGDVQSTGSQSTVTPLVKSSFLVTSSTTEITSTKEKQIENLKEHESANNEHKEDLSTTVNPEINSNSSFSEFSPVVTTEGTTISTTTTTTTLPALSKTLSRVSTVSHQGQLPYTHSSPPSSEKSKLTNTRSSEVLSSLAENSLYVKKTNAIKDSDKPTLLDIIEKAIEIEHITTAKPHISSHISSTTESTLGHKKHDLTTKAMIEHTPSLMDDSPNLSKPLNQQTTKDASSVNEKSMLQEKTSMPTSTIINPENLKPVGVKSDTKLKHQTIETKTSITKETVSYQSTTELPNMIELPITNGTHKVGNLSRDLHIQNIPSIASVKQPTSNESILTTEDKIQEVNTLETFKNPEIFQNKTNSNPVTQQVEQQIHEQTTARAITTVSSTTRFKTKFDVTKIKTTTKIDLPTKEINKTHKTSAFSTTEKSISASANIGSYSTKQQMSEYSLDKNKSPLDTIATGDINTMSSTNVPKINLSQAITMSHDLPESSKFDMSTVQTVMSNIITTEQQISSKHSENVRERTTTSTVKNDKQITTSFADRSSTVPTTETSLSVPTTKISTAEPKTKPSSSLRTPKISISVLTADASTSVPTSTITVQLPQKIKSTLELKLEKPDKDNNETNKKVALNSHSNSKKLNRTSPVSYLSQTKEHQSDINTSNEKSSYEVIEITTQNFEAKTKINTESKTPVTLHSEEQRSSKTSAKELKGPTSQHYETTKFHTQSTTPLTTPRHIALDDGVTNSGTPTTVHSSDVDVIEKFSTKSVPEVKDTSNSTIYVKNFNSTRNNQAENVSLREPDDTGQRADQSNTATESVIKTDGPVKVPSQKRTRTTGNVVNSAETPKKAISLTKAFLNEKQSDLLRKSKVKNELLSNTLSETVKDINFETELRDRGIPSHLDNIL